MALPNRFWSKVHKEPMTGCWLWTGSSGQGYGNYWHNGSSRRAHRVLYEDINGPLQAGLELDHLCRVRGCVNPEHLEPVTHRENIIRGEASSYWTSRTRCPQGHEYSKDNTYIGNKGERQCRQCRKAASLRYWKRKETLRALRDGKLKEAE